MSAAIVRATPARRWRRRLAWAAAAAAVALAALAALASWVLWPLPPSLLTRARGDGAVIEDRNGLPLRATRSADGTQRARIDPDLINAFVAVEDRRRTR